MRSFMIIVLLVAVGAVALSVHDATVSPASVPPTGPGPTSIAGARMLLLPDGKVEVTDALARRVFHWDGERWVEHDAVAASPAASP
jgi:hypothetical protein